MKTSIKHLEALNYTLLASVPGHMLHSCSAMIPRPWWEPWAYWFLNVGLILVLIIVVGFAIVDAERLVSQSCMAYLRMEQRGGQLLDLRSVAESVHQDLSSNGSSRRIWHHAQPTVQDVPSSVVKKAPSIKRIFSILRQFLRSFGIKMFGILKIFPPIPWPKWRNSKEANTPEDQDEAKDESKETENESDKKVKEVAKEPSKPNNSSKKKDQKKPGLSRKKSLPNNDLDEASSTTTESSIVEDLHDIKPQGQAKTKTNKQQAAKQKSTETPKDQVMPAQSKNTKQKAKKQNSVEGKRNSPERVPIESNPNPASKTAAKKTAPVMAPTQNKPPTNIKNEVQASPNLANQTPVQAEQQQKKVTPVGKVLPDIKRPENIGAQFGPVGAKPLPMKPNWNGNVANRNDLDSNGFAINGQFGAHGTGVPNAPSNAHFAGGHPQYQANRGDEFFHHVHPHQSHNSSNSNSPSRQPSFMSQLLNNRKQETAQFLRITNTDWPGFNENSSGPGALETNSFVESLWDDNPGSSNRTNIWNTWNNDHQQAGNAYIGGLSVGQQQRNNDPFRSHGPRGPQQQPDSFNGFQMDPLGLASNSIWSSGQPPTAASQQQAEQREHDELNQFQQRVMQPQQQQQQPAPSAWSNLFRENK